MLMGNGIFASPRQGLMPSSGPGGGTAVVRPMNSAISFRRTFDNDLCSFPSGLFQSAIVLPMKLGGMSMRGVAGASTLALAAIYGYGYATFTPTGSGSASLDRLAGTKWCTCEVTGLGGLALASVYGKAFVTLNVSIGSRPSADDIAYAVWGLASGIESGWTPREAMRILAAAMAGKSSNGGKTFRDLNNTKDRITGTMDGSGNRTAITLDPL